MTSSSCFYTILPLASNSSMIIDPVVLHPLSRQFYYSNINVGVSDKTRRDGIQQFVFTRTDNIFSRATPFTNSDARESHRWQGFKQEVTCRSEKFENQNISIRVSDYKGDRRGGYLLLK